MYVYDTKEKLNGNSGSDDGLNYASIDLHEPLKRTIPDPYPSCTFLRFYTINKLVGYDSCQSQFITLLLSIKNNLTIFSVS